MATLSVLYMIRNESKTIARSIESVGKIADEIIIVDTGSTDDTLRICRQFRKIKIFSFPWENDFSKPRNFGVSKCSGDWVFYIDGDEIVDNHSATTIRRAVDAAKSNVHGFGVKMVDHEESFESEPNPASFFPSPQVRVFRRNPQIIFTGAVMESVKESVKAMGGGIDVIDAKIDHWIWKGRGQGSATLKVKFYNKIGAKLELPTGVKNPPKNSEPQSFVVQDKAGIVITTMNACAITKTCLTSIIANTSGAYDVVAVDNGSSDGTPQVIKEIIGKRPLAMSKNVGVAKARNIGANQAMRDPAVKYVCFLDNDTRVAPGWLDGMLDILDENPNLGIIGPISCSASGAQDVSSQFQKKNYEDVQDLLKIRAPKLVPTDKVDGFCMIVKTEVIKKIGLLDETFGIYGYEAEDFCRRAKAAGYDIGVANQIYVQHRGKGTIGANKGEWPAELESAEAKYRKKWNDPAPWSSLPKDYSPPPSVKIPGRLRVMFLGRERGYEENMAHALSQWEKTCDFHKVDFVSLGRNHGGNAMSNTVYEQARAFFPDVLLTVLQDENFDPKNDTIKKISNLGTKTFGWFGDSALRYESFDKKWAPHLDFCVTTSAEAFEKYKADGFGGKAMLSKWAASPRCKASTLRKDIQVSCLNTLHYDLVKVLEDLKKEGIEVYAPGHVSMEERVEIINRSVINLNLASEIDGAQQEARHLNIDVPACGGFLLTNATRELREYYEPGVDVVMFSSAENLASKIKRYLSDLESRTTIATMGLSKSAFHSWPDRFNDIFGKAGLL